MLEVDVGDVGPVELGAGLDAAVEVAWVGGPVSEVTGELYAEVRVPFAPSDGEPDVDAEPGAEPWPWGDEAERG